jgi:hypothetical protein
MVKRVTLLVVAFAFFLPASASQPGQPLNCDDWVTAAPGLTIGIDSVPASFDTVLTDRVALDNEGGRIVVGNCCEAAPSPCDSSPFGHLSIRHVNRSGVVEVLACVPGRSGPIAGSLDLAEIAVSGCYDNANGWTSCVRFNPMTGELHFNFDQVGQGYTAGSGYQNYHSTRSCVLRGLSTLYDIQQTYTPASNTLNFRVPAMPEGLAAADHFDTYYGALTNPIDFTQAQPLQCGYPARPPSVGDYLTVADPLPNPAPGTGRYYVTAASYQGQRRYGRQRVRGVLSGRNPAKLPTCEQ